MLGVTLAAILLLTSRPDAAGTPAPAVVSVAMAPVGELEIT